MTLYIALMLIAVSKIAIIRHKPFAVQPLLIPRAETSVTAAQKVVTSQLFLPVAKAAHTEQNIIIQAKKAITVICAYPFLKTSVILRSVSTSLFCLFNLFEKLCIISVECAGKWDIVGRMV